MGIQQLMLGGVWQVVLTDHGVNDYDFATAPSTANASAQFNLALDGTANYDRLSGSDGTYDGEWLRYGNPADFEVRFTVVSGSFSSGTFGSWLNLGTTRLIAVTASRSTIGTTLNNGSATVEIRDASSGNILATATVTLTAIAEFDT